MRGISWLAEDPWASQYGLCSLELVGWLDNKSVIASTVDAMPWNNNHPHHSNCSTVRSVTPHTSLNTPWTQTRSFSLFILTLTTIINTTGSVYQTIVLNLPLFVHNVICDMFRPVLDHHRGTNSHTAWELLPAWYLNHMCSWQWDILYVLSMMSYSWFTACDKPNARTTFRQTFLNFQNMRYQRVMTVTWNIRYKRQPVWLQV